MNAGHAYEGVARSRVAWVVLLALVLGACESSGGNEERLPGERIPVLTVESEISPDPQLAGTPVSLPRPFENASWPLAGGSPTNAMHHLALGPRLDRTWRTTIGRGADGEKRLLAPPIVAGGRIYTIDTVALVTAINPANGRRIWDHRIELEGEKKREGFGGGLAYSGGRLFASTGYGLVVALDPANGREIWRYNAGVPFRGGITALEGRVFAVTHDNQVFALDAQSGDVIWDQVGIVENAGILGTATPAVSGDTLVVALSSGELLALRVENGQVAWQDALTRTRQMTPLATLNDIDGNPVIEGGRVYALSHSGRMVAIDIRSGERVWEINIGGTGTPWYAGGFLFLVTVDNQVVAVSARDGRVRWVRQLQRFQNQEKRRNVIRWSGPVLAGDRLVVVSNKGYALTLSPYTGEILSGEKIPDGSVIPPVVAGGTLYILTEDAELLAYR